jgi:ATP-dependent protease Clp ATPase subunit
MFPEQNKVKKQLHNLFTTFVKSGCKIRPHFFLTGPSGTGKSHLVQELAKASGAAYFEINAAQLTCEGISGMSLAKALTPLKLSHARPTIIFVDEFDKLLISVVAQTSESKSGVQDEFLKVLESDTVNIFGEYGKYDNVKCAKVLFVFSGAFDGEDIISLDDLKSKGLRSEFIGRVGLCIATQRIKMQSLINSLDESNLLTSYCEMDKLNDTEKELAINCITRIIKDDFEESTIGIRLVNSSIHQHFLEI